MPASIWLALPLWWLVNVVGGPRASAQAPAPECYGSEQLVAAGEAHGSLPVIEITDDGGLAVRRGEELIEGMVLPRLFDEQGRAVLRVDFAEGVTGGILMVEWYSPRSPRDVLSVACGQADDEGAYLLTLPDAVRGRDGVVRVRVLREPREGAEGRGSDDALNARRGAYPDPSEVERFRNAIMRWVAHREIENVSALDALRAFQASSSSGTEPLAAALAAIEGLLGSPGTSDQSTAHAMDFLGCLVEPSPRALALPACEAIEALRALLVTARTALADFAASHEARLRAVGAVVRVLSAGATDERGWACATYARVAWFDDGARLATIIEFPAVRSQSLSVLYGTGEAALSGIRDGGGPLGLLVRDVPMGTALSFRQAAGESLSRSVADVVALAARVFGGALSAEAGASFCPDAADTARLVDPEVPALAAVGTRAFVMQPLVEDRLTDLRLCAGAACVTSGASENVMDHVVITPRQRWAFTLFLQASFSAFSGDLELGELSYGVPSYQAIGGPAGPDQLFQLQRGWDVTRAVVVSGLLGFHFECFGPYSRHCAAAIGPSVTNLAGGNVLRQVDVIFGIELVDPLYLTFSTGIAFVGRRVDGSVADFASVPRMTPGSAPTAPTVPTTETANFVFGIGLALDLAVLGDGADEIVKALGGGS